MWLTNEHLYVPEITLVLKQFASVNGFLRLRGITICIQTMMDLMDQHVKETGMLRTGSWLCGIGETREAHLSGFAILRSKLYKSTLSSSWARRRSIHWVSAF